jgi:hypothetical protein
VSGGFRVDGSTLDEHALLVDGFAETMHRAAEAGRPLGLDAYGLIGQVFTITAAGAAEQASAAVGDLARRYDALRDGVRASRDAYLLVEGANAGQFGGPR